MIVTFLTANEFEKLAKAHNKSGRYFNAGFGLGRNVCKVIEIDGRIYLKLSPIADKYYAGTSEVVLSGSTTEEIERILELGEAE